MRSLGLRMEKAVPIKIAIICNLLFGTICFWLVRGGENISFLSCWSSDLEAFLSYYYSRNIVRRTNYCMEKMTGWVKMLWGSMFCRVCVTIQYFFFLRHIYITLVLHLVYSGLIISAWTLISFFLLYVKCYILASGVIQFLCGHF